MAFKIAAETCFHQAMLKATPIMLEPIDEIQISIPEEYLGDVMGDLSSRRGRISGTEADGRRQSIKALVPGAELYKYAAHLRSITQGRGTHQAKVVPLRRGAARDLRQADRRSAGRKGGRGARLIGGRRPGESCPALKMGDHQAQEGATDQARGKMFSKYIKEITIAARAGGDLAINPRLRTAVAAAKSVNMPASNIERAIARGSGRDRRGRPRRDPVRGLRHGRCRAPGRDRDRQPQPNGR
jgi:hypothetical protein